MLRGRGLRRASRVQGRGYGGVAKMRNPDFMCGASVARSRAPKSKSRWRTRHWRCGDCRAQTCFGEWQQLFALSEVESSEEQADTEDELMEVGGVQKPIVHAWCQLLQFARSRAPISMPRTGMRYWRCLDSGLKACMVPAVLFARSTAQKIKAQTRTSLWRCRGCSAKSVLARLPEQL